ncbi:tRNA (adenosine(37)-N6)-threonylcarbamoyltransferase complex dimerization subunit type 1 TsaB [Lysobacter hankyongensis]
MKLLAFELSTEACSVALWVDGDVRGRHEIAPRRHAELALPWAEALLAEAGIAKSQLDAVAVGRGPGAFTGVRLGVAIAQGIALALDRPAVPVSTLAALALRAVPLGAGLVDARGDDAGDRVFAAIDARMREVYVAAFAFERGIDGGLHPRPLDDARVQPPDAAMPPGEVTGWYGVGTALAAEGGALRTRLAPRLRAVDADALPHATDVAALAHAAFLRGEAVAPEQLEPAYLRNQVALTLVEQQALRARRDAGAP